METPDGTPQQGLGEGETGGKIAAQGQEHKQELHLRERAIARTEDLLSTKVELAVGKKLEELEIPDERIKSAKKVFKMIAGAYPATIGKAVSKKEREDDGLDAQELVYGEIQFETFALALEKIRHLYKGLAAPGGVFVDIGSGTGKPVFAAMLMHEFDKVVGVEILNGLHEISQELLAIWRESKSTTSVSAKTKATDVELIRGDAFEVDWSDADVAFVNSTCFDDGMMERVAAKADLLKPGSFFISFTRRIPSDRWQVLEYERHLMSWGDATVFIHQRKSDKVADDEALTT